MIKYVVQVRVQPTDPWEPHLPDVTPSDQIGLHKKAAARAKELRDAGFETQVRKVEIKWLTNP